MDETIKLIEMAHKGDKNARDRLVMDNVGLIWSIVRRFSGRGYELEDLFQIGSIGLMKRFLRDDGMIKVSRSIKELGAKAGAARESLSTSLGREPTIDEIAYQLQVSVEEVAASMEAGAEVESLYKSVGGSDEKNICLMDRLEEESSGEEELLNRMVLKELLMSLGEKEREIIVRRYFYNQTQSYIAKDLNISQVQVSRLEKKILKQLREKI